MIAVRIARIDRLGTADGAEPVPPIDDLGVGGRIGLIVETEVDRPAEIVWSPKAILGQAGMALLLQPAVLVHRAQFILGRGGEAGIGSPHLLAPVIGSRR